MASMKLVLPLSKLSSAGGALILLRGWHPQETKALAHHRLDRTGSISCVTSIGKYQWQTIVLVGAMMVFNLRGVKNYRSCAAEAFSPVYDGKTC